jgi:uncharacterized iron-regulated membrane protein
MKLIIALLLTATAVWAKKEIIIVAPKYSRSYYKTVSRVKRSYPRSKIKVMSKREYRNLVNRHRYLTPNKPVPTAVIPAQ